MLTRGPFRRIGRQLSGTFWSAVSKTLGFLETEIRHLSAAELERMLDLPGLLVDLQTEVRDPGCGQRGVESSLGMEQGD